jgi:cell division protein FtsI/penicillin-binding protein 2
MGSWRITGKTLERIRAGQKYTEENYSARVLSKRFIEEVRRQLRNVIWGAQTI